MATDARTPSRCPRGREAPRRWRLREVEGVEGQSRVTARRPAPGVTAAARPGTGVRMKRGNQFTDVARAVGTAKPQATPASLDGVIDDDRNAGRDAAAALRHAAREIEPPTSDRPAGGFDDLRAGAPRRIPAAVLSHGTLRGVGPGRGDGLATEPPAGGEQRGQEGADAGCSEEDVPADQRERLGGRRVGVLVRLGRPCTENSDRPNRPQAGNEVTDCNARCRCPWARVAGRHGTPIAANSQLFDLSRSFLQVNDTAPSTSVQRHSQPRLVQLVHSTDVKGDFERLGHPHHRRRVPIP